MGMLLLLLGLALASWILLPCLLLVFPLITNWLASRARRPRKGLAQVWGALPCRFYGGSRRKKSLVILVHGRSRSAGFMEPLALALSRNWDVLTFDLRHHGDRGYGSVTYGLLEAKDFLPLLRSPQARAYKHMGLAGVSMGGAAAARALSLGRFPRVRALALINPVHSAALLVSEFSPYFGLPAFLKPLLIRLGSLISGADLRQARTSAWLKSVKAPKALFLASRDRVLGPQHGRLLRKEVRFSLVAEYAGGHDDPANKDLQAQLRRWLHPKLP